MSVESQRLRLILLTEEQAKLYFLGNNLLERNLGIPDASRIIDPHFKEVAETVFLPNLKKDPANSLFYSFFIFIERTSGEIAGEMGCHSLPNEQGEVEIGYSTQMPFQNKGYMSEAVHAFSGLLLSSEKVSTVMAVTDNSNIPSQKVLINNHFKADTITEMNTVWKLKKVI